MKNIKIAHITLSMGVGGAEILLLNLLKNIDCTQFSNMVVCLDEGGDLLGQVHDLNILSIVFKRRPGIDWRLILKLTRFFRENKFNIVHSHNQGAHFYTALAAKMAGVPVIMTTEHSRHRIEESRMRRLEKRVLAMLTDKWVTVNQELADLSVNSECLDSGKVTVIPNGIDCELFSHRSLIADGLKEKLLIPKHSKIIIMIARLHPVKNHSLLLDAYSCLRDTYPDLHVLLVGDGESRSDLEKHVLRNKTVEKVHFLGSREDICDLLWLSDIFVLCSRSEGLPLSLLEACAAGVPVVITKESNRAGFIVNGKMGTVCEGTITGLASAIESVLENIVECNEMVKLAQFVVKEHQSLSAMVDRYDHLYKDLVFNK